MEEVEEMRGVSSTDTDVKKPLPEFVVWEPPAFVVAEDEENKQEILTQKELLELNEALTPMIAEARIGGLENKLNFLERKLKTDISVMLNRSFNPDEDREPESMPFLVDPKEKQNSRKSGVVFR